MTQTGQEPMLPKKPWVYIPEPVPFRQPMTKEEIQQLKDTLAKAIDEVIADAEAGKIRVVASASWYTRPVQITKLGGGREYKTEEDSKGRKWQCTEYSGRGNISVNWVPVGDEPLRGAVEGVE